MGAARHAGELRDQLWFQLLLVGLAAIGPFSLNIFKPCLPWIKADLAAPIEVVQLGLSLSILVAAFATVGLGTSADRLGRRPVILTSLWLYVVSSLTCAVAPSIGILVAGRVVQAASSSVGLATARTVIHDTYGEGKSAPIIARVTFITVLCVLLAPAFGGAIIDRVGWRAVFGCSAAVGVLLLLPAHLRLRETGAPDGRATKGAFGLEGVVVLLKSPVFLGFAVQSSLHFAMFFAFTSAAAYIMVDFLGRNATEYGLWFIGMAFMAAAGLWAAKVLAQRVRMGLLSFVGSTIVGVGSVACAYFMLVGALTPARLFVPATFASFGIGLALPGTNAGVMEVDWRWAGTASGLLGFMQMVLAALAAQAIAIDLSMPPRLLALLVLGGGVGSFLFSLLSLRHGKLAAPTEDSP